MASDPHEIIFTPEPDPLEKKVRIGCGSVTGLFLGVLTGLYWWPTAVGVALIVAASVLSCAWMALKFGDRFWTEGVMKWLSWW